MNVKTQNFFTTTGKEIAILWEYQDDISALLLANRGILSENLDAFFSPTLADLHDPFLMPDILPAVERILQAVKNDERIVIFGDYDVDGVSSTAVVVRFLANELKAKVSYRLPHRVYDGYGLKEYFFDELAEKWVTLVVTVDCGTRDILPITYAKKLWIDVVVTDHHAVPEIIPTEVVGVTNPKRKDSRYPFSNLAGAGVAFKLIHAILLTLEKTDENFRGKTEKILENYVDLASLGTVADCMPLVDENRIITTLGLKKMKNSESAGLKKFVQSVENLEWNADIIGFQIGPRINAAGRMDTPLLALRWLLASESRSDEFFEKLEHLNSERKEVVQDFTEKALLSINPNDEILFFLDEKLEHGLIGLVAGKLTENYNRISIVLCPHKETNGSISYVASCRAPEWCNLMEILDDSAELFLRYGGHKQAAGFSVSPENFPLLQEKMKKKFLEIYGENLPNPVLKVEAKISPKDVNLNLVEIIEKFKPFGIGNPRPLWLFEGVEITEIRTMGAEWQHRKIYLKENPNLPLLYWNATDTELLEVGQKISFVVDFDKNIFNGKVSVQAFIKFIVTKK